MRAKFLYFILVLLVLLVLPGCEGSDSVDPDGDGTKVISMTVKNIVMET